jgi:hypothetical protein
MERATGVEPATSSLEFSIEVDVLFFCRRSLVDIFSPLKSFSDLPHFRLFSHLLLLSWARFGHVARTGLRWM